jgi:adenosylmethionine-8-amino-7-oxononanoate aminotransferase
VVVLMPALAMTEHDLRRLVAITAAAIEEVTPARASRAA